MTTTRTPRSGRWREPGSTPSSRWPGRISRRSRSSFPFRTPAAATTSSRSSTCGATSSRRSASARREPRPRNFLIAGPGWQGTPPADIDQTFRSPTRFVWVNGQMQANGPQDCAAVNALQKQYKLTPLSAWGEPWSPPAEVPVPPGLDTTPPLERVQKMDAGAFFGRLARLMKDNPPAPADAQDGRDAEGGRHRAREGLRHRRGQPAHRQGPQRAMGTFGILQKALKKLKTENGWIVIPENFANYGTDYKTRAGIALIGLGGIWRQDVLYPAAFIDGDGKPLDGANRYVLHFDKGQTPPANATWSMSMYNPQGYSCRTRSTATTWPRGCRSRTTPTARSTSSSRPGRRARRRRPTGCPRPRAGRSVSRADLLADGGDARRHLQAAAGEDAAMSRLPGRSLVSGKSLSSLRRNWM